ncbi:MAG: phenylalanine--tRNA ligase subunit alpha [Candidatus Cloacimonetes bacterium]|nr:phenylalanine--tRNA ligase subunit alpha [Candidatus Cloacimonadota bacterium]
MKEDLKRIIEAAEQQILNAKSLPELLNLKSSFLGKKSELSQLMLKLRDLTPEERPAFGKAINDAKGVLDNLITEKQESLKSAEIDRQHKGSSVDLTMPGRRFNKGSLHPLTLIWREIEDVFISLGFEVAEGTDIEDEFHNFDALNTPQDHPSRNLADTFYVENSQLLRTHTSPVQIRTMERYVPPIRIISPGRAYRNDKIDATHSPVFHQVEALYVDENVSFADLKDTLNQFVVKMFGAGTKSRIRPHFFPFTEPSAEIDISCVACGGKGCRVCKESGWLEMGGAGMVDPNVFKHTGIDSEKYTGFAFGLGMDRIAMLKYDIKDIRVLFDNDLRVLKQFRNENR